MIRPLVLTSILTVIVCGCGHAHTNRQHNATTVAQTTHHAPVPAPSTDSAQSAVTPQNENQQAAAAQESAGTADDDHAPPDRGDVSLERLAALPPDAQLPSGKWKPGANYDVLTPAQPTNVGPGKVEVVEVFWLACPHCYALEPFVQGWLKNKPPYIEFVRVPVMWQPLHRAHAHLFYTLQALGRNDLIAKAFETIAQQHVLLASQEG